MLNEPIFEYIGIGDIYVSGKSPVYTGVQLIKHDL